MNPPERPPGKLWRFFGMGGGGRGEQVAALILCNLRKLDLLRRERSPRSDLIESSLRCLRSLVHATTASDIVLFTAVRGGSVKIPSHLYGAGSEIALLSWLFYSVRNPFFFGNPSQDEQLAILHILCRLWSAEFADPLANIVADLTNVYQADVFLHFGFLRLISSLAEPIISPRSLKQLQSYVVASRNLIALDLKDLSNVTLGDLESPAIYRQQVCADVSFGYLARDTKSNLSTPARGSNLRRRTPRVRPRLNPNLIVRMLKSWHELAEAAIGQGGVTGSDESCTSLSMTSTCIIDQRSCSGQHGRFALWSVCVILVCDFVRILTDCCVFYCVRGRRRQFEEAARHIEEILECYLYEFNLLPQVARLYYQIGMLRRVCPDERNLYAKVKPRLGGLVRQTLELASFVDSPGGVFADAFPGVIRSQLDSLCSFMFVDEGYGLQKRLKPWGIWDKGRLLLDWRQSTALWLELMLSPVWLEGELRGFMPGYRRLADALAATSTSLTTLRLIRLTITTMSTAFGMNGLPSGASTAFEVLRRRLQGINDIEPRHLTLGDAMGLQCCYALAQAGVAESLRVKSQRLSFSPDRQSLSFKGIRLVQKIARSVLLLTRDGLGYNNWEAGRQAELDVSLLPQTRTKFPRLEDNVCRSVEDWLLAADLEDNLPESDRIPTLADVVKYCCRIEIETAIAMMEEGAGYFAQIWRVPRPRAAGVRTLLHKNYPVNTAGYYFFPFCDSHWAPPSCQKRLMKDREVTNQRVYPKFSEHVGSTSTSQSPIQSREPISPRILELTESVKVATNNYMLWNSVTWGGLSNMAYEFDRQAASENFLSEVITSGAPTECPTRATDVVYWTPKEDSAISLKSTTTSESRDSSPNFPLDRRESTSAVSNLSSSTSIESTQEIIPERRDSWAPTQLDCLLTGWSLKRKFLFWSAWCFRASRQAVASLLRREELMWAGRFHPLVSRLTPETGRLYLESRLHASESRSAYTQHLNDAVEELVLKSNTAETCLNRETGVIEWEPRTPDQKRWNWMEVLKLASTVAITSLQEIRESKAFYAFAQSMERYFGLRRTILQEAFDIPLESETSETVISERDYCYPTLTSVFLIKACVAYAETSHLNEVPLDQLVRRLLKSLRQGLIHTLQRVVESDPLDLPGFRSVLCLTRHSLGEVADEISYEVSKLLEGVAARVEEIDPSTLLRFVSVLSPGIIPGHLEVLCKLLKTSQPLQAFIVVCVIGHTYIHSAEEMGGWGESRAEAKVQYFNALFNLKERMLKRRLSQEWQEEQNLRPSLSFEFCLMSSALDPHLQLLSLMDQRLLFLQNIVPSESYENVSFAHLWEGSDTVPWSMRRALLLKLDAFPPTEVIETLERWLEKFPAHEIPLEAPTVLRAESFSVFAPYCAGKMVLDRTELIKYQCSMGSPDSQLLIFDRPLVNAVLTCKSRSPSAAGKTAWRRGNWRPPPPSVRISLRIRLRRRKLCGVPPQLWGIDDMLDTSPPHASWHCIIECGDYSAVVPVVMRPMPVPPDTLAHLFYDVAPIRFSASHWFWPFITCPEVDVTAPHPNPRRSHIVLSYLMPWLLQRRVVDPAPERGLKNWARDLLPSYGDGNSMWFNATAVMAEPIRHLSSYPPETCIRCALSLHLHTQYNKNGFSSNAKSPVAYINQFGQISSRPAWQIDTLGSIRRRCVGGSAIGAGYQLSFNPNSQYQWICATSSVQGTNAESGDRARTTGNDAAGPPGDHHLIGVSFIFRMYILQDEEEMHWLSHGLLKLRKKLQKEHQRLTSKNLWELRAPYLKAPRPPPGLELEPILEESEHNVASHPTYVHLLETLHKIGIRGKRPPNAWVPPTRNFSPAAGGSILSVLALSSVGRQIIRQNLQCLGGSKQYLLNHTGVQHRLLGVAVELGGAYHTSCDAVEVLNQTFGPLKSVTTAAGALSRLFLGAVQTTSREHTESTRVPFGHRKSLDTADCHNPLVQIDCDKPLHKPGGQPWCKLKLITEHASTLLHVLREAYVVEARKVKKRAMWLRGARDQRRKAALRQFMIALNPTQPLPPRILRLLEAGGLNNSHECADEIASQFSDTLKCPAFAFNEKHLEIVNLVCAIRNVILRNPKRLVEVIGTHVADKPTLFLSVELWWRISKVIETYDFDVETTRKLNTIVSHLQRDARVVTLDYEQRVLWDTLDYGWYLYTSRTLHHISRN